MQNIPTTALAFDAVRVLVIGDIMLDWFRYGQVNRLSPEAPVPVMRVKEDRIMLGGAGNVATNLVSLGCSCAVIAVTGEDATGAKLRELLESSGIDASGIVADRSRRTTIKTRLIGGSQQLLRFDEEDVGNVNKDTEQAIIDRFDGMVAECTIVAISDYAKGVLSDRVLAHVIGRCRELGIPALVDPKRTDMRGYAGATLIKPNLSELKAATGVDGHSIEQVTKAAGMLNEQTGAMILVTMSEAGMALFGQDGERWRFQAREAEVFDVSGAGDTALATLCAAWGAGYEPEQAVRLANVAAGVVVRKLGTASVTIEELALALDSEDQETHVGVASQAKARMQVLTWKRQGLRVGFTNGCFDIIHAGHIRILQEARKRCDRLVVGLNSDASVSRLKGPDRPVQTETSRGIVLSAVDAVDLVVVFEEDTPLELIKLLKPTDLIKGADYTEETVAGAAEVKAGGGRVHLIDLVPGVSTSRAVERIRNGQNAAGVAAGTAIASPDLYGHIG
jgi:D-beta-D-heptose 7-phosphate kinase / D-beta-D-heptose 1-phosphate adenosyltransferase